MIRINLYDYREEIKRIAVQKQVIKAASIVLGAFLLIVASGLIEIVQLDMVEAEVATLDKQIKALDSKVKEVRKMKSRRLRMNQIVAGIESLRNKQMQATRIFSDLNLNVPDSVWLTSITQRTKRDLEKKKVPTIFVQDSAKKGKKRKRKKQNLPYEFLEIRGQALEDHAVATYIEYLESIPYFKVVFLYQTKQVMIGLTPVREFTIYCYMPEKKKKAAA